MTGREDDDVERQWREAVRKQREDERPGPYGGNYGGGGNGGGGCFLIGLVLVAIVLALLGA